MPLSVPRRGGLPSSGVAAVVINVIASDDTAPKFLTVYASARTQPTASNLNVDPGEDVPYLVIVGTGTNSQITFLQPNTGSVDVVGEVTATSSRAR
jgi:hypothetical protein